MPARSPYRPVKVVSRSSAVCAMSGVWLLAASVPLPVRKCSRLGIISRSEGTLGLSRKKWTLSKVSSMTCLTPLPRRQLLPASERAAAEARAGGCPADADPGAAAPTAAIPLSSVAHPVMAAALTASRRRRWCCRIAPPLPAARLGWPASPAVDPRDAARTPGNRRKACGPTFPWPLLGPLSPSSYACLHLLPSPGARLGPLADL